MALPVRFPPAGKIRQTALLFAAVLLAGRSALAAPDSTPAKQPGDAAPPFLLKLANPPADGPAVFDSRDYVGEDAEHPARLLLISFFATWCSPCKKELPELVKMAAAYKDAGLAVVSIAIDKEAEGIAQIPDLVKRFGVVHPVASDSMNIVARRYLGSDVKLPSLVMIGQDGNIVQLHQGYGDDVKNNLEAEIRGALGLPGRPHGLGVVTK